jgi:transcriptional regulator with XRE-family HTH domain
MIDIGAKITMLRKQKGLSQTDLAEKINCSRATLINYEGNKNTPSIEIAVKMAEVFDVSLDFLIGEGSNSKFDKKTLKRLHDIEELDQGTKDKMFFFIDTVIRDYKASQAYSSK